MSSSQHCDSETLLRPPLVRGNDARMVKRRFEHDAVRTAVPVNVSVDVLIEGVCQSCCATITGEVGV
jgi:hypothetical protein